MLYFDQAANERVRAIQAKLVTARSDSGKLTPSPRPHISLGACQGINPESFRAPLAEFARQSSTIRFELTAIGTFPTSDGVIFLTPAVSRALLNLHERFSELFGDYAVSPSSYYLPGSWVPHCTLALDVPDNSVAAALDLCRTADLPIHGSYERIGLVRFLPNEEIYCFDLGRRG